MTYAAFLGVFVVLPILLSLWPCRRGLARRGWVSLMALLAIVYVAATPWDAVGIARGLWDFAPERLVGVRFWGVPIEELAFFGLQTMLTGLWARRRLVSA
jgi:lycopene cyclase domain-containing protein